MNALKRFGLGLLWVFLIPFILLGIALVAVLGVLNFPVQLVILIINFFRGKKIFPLFEEDEKAMAILQKAIDKANGEEPLPPASTPQQVVIQQNYYGSFPPPQPGPNLPYQNPQSLPNQYPQQGLPFQAQQLPRQPQEPLSTLPAAEQEATPTVELSSLPQYQKKEDK